MADEKKDGAEESSQAPRFRQSGATTPGVQNQSNGGDSAVAGASKKTSRKKSTKKKASASSKKTTTPKRKVPVQITMMTVANVCGGLMYLRGPEIGEVRLAHGDSFTESKALMPLGRIKQLKRDGKIRVSEHLVDGEK